MENKRVIELRGSLEMGVLTMRKVFLFAVSLGFALAMGQIGAQAFTTLGANPVKGSDVTTIAGGCGPGWHRGPLGGCRRNFSPAFRCFWRGGRRICR